MVGIFQAWDEGYFDVSLAVIILAAAFTSHAFMEVWDELKDYTNYRQNIYGEPTQPPTLFSGGSGVLTGRLLTVSQVWVFFYVLLAVYTVLLAVIIHQVGFRFLFCVAAGLFFLFGYNSKLKLSYIGLGEFANFISFGPILVFSAYIAMRLGASSASSTADAETLNLLRLLNPTIIKEALVLGFIWFASLHVQEMLDYEEDKQGNKRTLVVRFGKKYASHVPFVCSIIILAVVVSLVLESLAFSIVLPAALLNMYETFDFLKKWTDQEYFLRKMKSFFVYRNFILVCFGLLFSYLLKSAGTEAQTEAFVLLMLAIASSLPAFAFLVKNKVFKPI